MIKNEEGNFPQLTILYVIPFKNFTFNFIITNMEDEEISFEKGQRRMDEWFDELPSKIEENYNNLIQGIKKFETFQVTGVILDFF